MIRATITISVLYAPDADMKEAEEDKVEVEAILKDLFQSSIAEPKDLNIDYTIAEVEVSKE